ncbi:germin-like protein 5-1 [Cryptomeria japonica]|uniref:germin-like protein 5-1 n=1 Tax=Cryptomeria japonica TaxID=3369 RepID=UPI0027DA6881|nr:germin-like protein 5-1 [Cryptomeria japonica]
MVSADPDVLQDYCLADTKSSAIFINGLPCLSPNETSAKHFTTSALGSPANTSGSIYGFGGTLTNAQMLPGINTLGISIARADLEVGGQVPLHTRPRATEIVYILQGKLVAGFVNSSNKLFSHTVKAGDVFVFPKGTLHFVHNIGGTHASLIAAFNSQNGGVAVTPMITLAANPGIPPEVLSKAFQISSKDVKKIRKGLGGN